MAKNRTYDTERNSISDHYAERARIEPSGTTLSLDAILNDCERIMEMQESEEENMTYREDTQ